MSLLMKMGHLVSIFRYNFFSFFRSSSALDSSPTIADSFCIVAVYAFGRRINSVPPAASDLQHLSSPADKRFAQYLATGDMNAPERKQRKNPEEQELMSPGIDMANNPELEGLKPCTKPACKEVAKHIITARSRLRDERHAIMLDIENMTHELTDEETHLDSLEDESSTSMALTSSLDVSLLLLSFLGCLTCVFVVSALLIHTCSLLVYHRAKWRTSKRDSSRQRRLKQLWTKKRPI
jgi:hypothetical protein